MKTTVVQKQHLRLSSVLHTHAYTYVHRQLGAHTHTEAQLLVIPLPGLAFARKCLLFGWLASPNPMNAGLGISNDTLTCYILMLMIM